MFTLANGNYIEGKKLLLQYLQSLSTQKHGPFETDSPKNTGTYVHQKKKKKN